MDFSVYFLQVLYIQAFVFVVLFGKLLRKVFFGQLRAAELEVGKVISHFPSTYSMFMKKHV